MPLLSDGTINELQRRNNASDAVVSDGTRTALANRGENPQRNLIDDIMEGRYERQARDLIHRDAIRREIDTLKTENPAVAPDIIKMQEDGKSIEEIQSHVLKRQIEEHEKERAEKEKESKLSPGRTAKETAKGVGTGFGLVGKGVGFGTMLVGEFLKGGKETGYDYMTGAPIPGTDDEKNKFLQGVLDRVSGALNSTGKETIEFYGKQMEKIQPDPSIQGNIVDKPELMLDPAWWGSNIGQMAPALGASIIAGIATGGVGAGVVGGAVEGVGTYEEGINRGMSEQDAMNAGLKQGVVTGILNAISVEKMLNPSAQNALKRFLITGSTEALTEAAEEPAEGVVFGEDWNQFKGRLKDAVTVMPTAFVTGAGGSFAGGDSPNGGDVQNTDKTKQPFTPSSPERMQEVRGEVHPHQGIVNEFVAHINEKRGTQFTENAYKPVDATTEEQQTAQKIASEFGQDVIFVNALEEDADFFNGTNFKNKIILNAKVDPETHHIQIAGHEILHQLRQENPELYALLNDVLAKETDGFKSFKENAGENIELTDDEIMEEWGANLVGERMSDPEFYKKLFAKNPTLLDKFKEIIDKILAQLKIGNTYKDSKFVSDLDKVNSTIDDLMKKYRGDKKFEQIRAEIKIKAEKEVATREAIKKKTKDSKVVALRKSEDDRGRYAVLHPSSKFPGKIQVTYYDDKGAFGDSTEKSMEDAINSAVKDGYVGHVEIEEADRMLNKSMSSPLSVGNLGGNEAFLKRIEKAEKKETSAKKLKAEKPKEPVVTRDPITPVATGKKGTAKTESGVEVEYDYALVDANDIEASHDTDLSANKKYPKELQPRDRTKVASEVQINKITNNLMPERLGENPMASEGAPIIGKEGYVESGNARTIALKRLYEQGGENVETYRAWLIENAEQFGLDPETIRSMEHPILTRRRLSDVDVRKFVEDANVQSTASMSAGEQAVADAPKLSVDVLNQFVPNDNGDINTAANADFRRTFFDRVIGETELGRYVDKKGNITQDGLNRIRNAIFAKAYGDPNVIERLAESTDSNIKNITNAMLNVAPSIATLNESIEEGTRHDLPITEDIAMASEKLSTLREQGMLIDEYLRQESMFGDDITPLAKDILRVFDTYKRSAKKLTAIFDNYIELVHRLGDPNQADMFGGSNIPSESELLQTAVDMVENGVSVDKNQADIFQEENAGVRFSKKRNKKLNVTPSTAIFDTKDSRTNEEIKAGESVWYLPDTGETIKQSTYRNLTQGTEQQALDLDVEKKSNPLLVKKNKDQTVLSFDDTGYSVKENTQTNMFDDLIGQTNLFDDAKFSRKRSQTELPIEVEDQDPTKVWNAWHAEKDEKIQKAKSEGARLQDRIKASTSEKRYGKESQKVDQAIQLYIDLKGKHIDEFEKYGDELTDEQKALYERSQNLTPEQIKIAEDIIASNKRTGLKGLNANVIRNVLDNYTMRLWKKGGGFVESTNKKFGIHTNRAKRRTLSSILEGWAKGKELQVQGATNALVVMQAEIAKTIENRNFMKSAMYYGLMSHDKKSGWVRIEHPSFRTHYKNENDGKIYERAVYAEPKLGKKLNNVLRDPGSFSSDFTKGLLKANAHIKQTILTTTFYHHLAFTRSYLLGGAVGIKDVNPIKAYKEGVDIVKKFEGDIVTLVRAGLTLGRVQDFDETAWSKEQTRIGNMIDKVPGGKAVKDKILEYNKWQTDFLFNRFGLGLKAKTAILEYQHLLRKYDKELTTGKMSHEEIATMVANLVNDDFGGLHLERMGRNPDDQRWLRLGLLAPDWTESNVRTMVKAFKTGKEGNLYRKFWTRAIIRGAVSNVIMNYLFSLFDDDSFLERYHNAWKEGRLRWMEIDIMPLARKFGGDPNRESYFNLAGHFKDPIKWLDPKYQEGDDPLDLMPLESLLTSLKHKASPLGRFILEAISGSDWAGRRYTTASEFLGVDDKGTYKTTRIGKYRKGQPKGGKLKGRIVSNYRGSMKPLSGSQMPSFAFGQARASLPIPLQNALQALNGDIDGFTAFAKSIGLHVTPSYRNPEEKKK